ncbi:MAG: PilW family protein [Pseudomonadota bacterium]|nr:PilW family protein [Pseudomonadota bacterium]
MLRVESANGKFYTENGHSGNYSDGYGEDTDGDRTADVYRDANAVFDWSAVVSTRIHLLLRSNDNNLSVAPTDYIRGCAKIRAR